MNMSDIINNRIDFLYVFDVTDGNPNGDPDSDNMPRFDPETMQGLVSDVSLKRKIRDYVYEAKRTNGNVQTGYDIYVLQGYSLENRQRRAYDHLTELAGKAQGGKTDKDDIERARQWMCANFYDVRTFGAVMNVTEFRCGQVRGPVQLTFSRSVDRILQTEHAITRVAYTNEQKHQEKSTTTEIGHKHTVSYGLYRAHGFINPRFAQDTGFTRDDLELLWQALGNMLGAFDASAARGLMAARHLFVFEHSSPLGVAPAHRLFELVRTDKRADRDVPRCYADYAISTIEQIRSALPEGVTVTDRIG